MKHASPPSIFTSRSSFSRQSPPRSQQPALASTSSPPDPSCARPSYFSRDSSLSCRQSPPAGRDPAASSQAQSADSAPGGASINTCGPATGALLNATASGNAAAVTIETTSPSPPPWAAVADRTSAPSTPLGTASTSLGAGANFSASRALAGYAPHSLHPTTPLPRTLPYKRARSPRSSPPESLPASEPAQKRPRLRPRPKHILDGKAFSSQNFHGISQPPSPLFFSNTPHLRPTLPPRFSSSEAAARMLTKARTEDSHIKTVSLARGTIRTPGGPAPTSTPGSSSRKSQERNINARSSSPEGTSILDTDAVLSSIGIVELLDHDDRPTFIVDLGNSANYGPGPLQLVFANASLRSYESLHSTVAGTPQSAASSAGLKSFLQFKSWLLSAAINGESLDVCLPPFMYSSMTWSCTTLRKKLRLISGVFASPPPSSTATLQVPAAVALSDHPSSRSMTEASHAKEPSDYFFPLPEAVSSTAMEGVTSSVNHVLPSIESNKGDSDSPDPSILESATDAMPTASTFAGSSTRGAGAVMTPTGLSASPESLRRDDVAETVPWSSAGLLDARLDAPSFDWTSIPLTDSLPEHIQFARRVDWAATSLGPIETWDADLRQMCNLIMASPHPSAMYWGEDLVAIYNEAYVVLAGQKHPRLMGMTYREAWSEIWDEVKDAFANAKSTGQATMKDDDCLFIRRNDYLEETYFSWSIIPIVGRNGSVMGLHNPAFEKTRRKIAERRMLTLREIGERTAAARDVKGFWAQVLGSFEFNEHDSPFLLLYSVADENDSDSSSTHSNSVFTSRQCTLEGSLGVPQNHPAAPLQIDLRSGMEGFGPVFREVVNTDKPVLLQVGSRDLPETLIEGLDFRGFGDRIRSVVVCPIHPTTGESVLGFLVLGVNPRRPYDDDYSLFVQLLSRQLATSLASVVLFEEEIRRGQRAAKLAALDRIELSEQLATRTQEAMDSETKFTRMAEFVPVGIFIADSNGKITFANDSWYDISRVPKESNMADTWMEAVKPDDMALVEKIWKDLVIHRKVVSSEFRFRAPWQDRNGSKGETWVLLSAYPERSHDGKLKSIFGSITDISQQKWAEGLQFRKMEEAVELKRQQENFIDITSHEMRNPLSAILQCADEILTSVTQYREAGAEQVPLDELLNSCLDAAQTISLCSQHQKRIVDDILTLSKLDSALLLVTPVDAQPLTVVQRALKMHEGELQAADIQMKFVVDQSFRDMELDWVRFDPSRVLQVLLNLTTNAIKFTGSESKRTITVTIGASKSKPNDTSDAPVKYFPTRAKSKDNMGESGWGDGEKVYIHFAVRDTGRGLSPEEKKLLFIRFSQASPRTHVQYGGSGLGLFISRELTEMQGGEIGVESEAGKGSTFAFYVAARRSSPPSDATDGATGVKRTESRKLSEPAGRKGSTVSSQRFENSSKSFAAASTANGSQALRRRVLIVEDNLVNQKVLQKQLKNIGTEVFLANHGGEALEKLKQSTYWRTNDDKSTDRLELGVVLMDQEMPVMDGLTCTRRIRELEAEGKLITHVPIIAVTANARPEQIQTALDAGMDDVVSKPFRIPDLVPKIEELMHKYPMPTADAGS